MTCSVYRLESESLESATVVRHADRSVRIVGGWEIVWGFELTGRDPVDTRSLHIARREVDESCELGDGEYHRGLREPMESWETLYGARFFTF